MLELKPNLAPLLQSRVETIEGGPRPGECAFIPSPWPKMNASLGGWVNGILSLILMHSGDGKSSLLRTSMLAAAKHGHPCLLLSTEDPEPYVLDRFLAELTGIPTAGLSRLEASKTELSQLKAACDLACLKNITVLSDDFNVSETLDTVTDFLEQSRGKKPALIGIDYLQNLVVGKDMEPELAILGQGLNRLAGKHRAAILGTSQVRSEALNEAKARVVRQKLPANPPSNWVEFASWFQPTSGDAEGCRRLEKSAKFFMSAYRPGKWARIPPLSWGVDDDLFHITLIKSNFTDGTGGTQHLRWVGETQSIREV